MGDAPQPTGPIEGLPPERPGRRIAGGLAVFVLLVLVLQWTSSEMPPPEAVEPRITANTNRNANSGDGRGNANAGSQPPPETQPADSIPDRTPPPVIDDPLHAHVEIDTLADRQTAWLEITVATAMGQRAIADAHYTPDNEFTIQTTNVSGFRIDLSSLPVLMGQHVILHIDGQNLALHLKKHATLTFQRSPAGSWFLLSH